MSQASVELWPLGLYFMCVIGLIFLMLVVSWFLSHKSHNPQSAARNEPYESGIVGIGFGRFRIAAHFYVVAMLFVLFDLEVVYIVAWAIAYDSVGWYGYIGLLVFVGILVVGLVYEWRMGALDWHTGGRSMPSVQKPMYIHPPDQGG